MTPKKLCLPVFLLVLALVSPFIDLPAESSAAAAAPVPAKADLAAPAPEIVPDVFPAAQPERPETPAVRTVPSTVAFASGVPGLSSKVFTMALAAVSSARARGISGRNDLLTIIDYSLPSTEPRLWVLDLAQGKVLYHELVAHGSGSGANYATHFSNEMNSRQTSLGLFLTGGTYEGGNGYSLRLRGLDRGVNDRAEERHIVMHGAWYVSREHVRNQGRLGRSWGCPALSEGVAPTVIDLIKGGSFLFSYAKGAASLPKYAG